MIKTSEYLNIKSYPMASTVAMSFDRILKFLRFQSVKNKALSKRFLCIYIPAPYKPYRMVPA